MRASEVSSAPIPVSIARMHGRSGLALAMTAAFACLPSCSASHRETETVEGAPCVPPDVPARFFWFLVHPTNAPPDGPGIYLQEEGAEKSACKLGLPERLISPHALAYDGDLLWVGGAVSAEPRGAIFAIDPKTGEVVNEIATTGLPEGVAVAGDNLWYGASFWPGFGSRARLVQIDRAGNTLDEVVPESSVVQDVAVLDDRLFYAVNDEVDRILEVMPDGAPEREVVRHAGGNDAVYTLTSRLGLLVVEGGGALHGYDPDSGEMRTTVAHGVGGWITAIAPTSDP